MLRIGVAVALLVLAGCAGTEKRVDDDYYVPSSQTQVQAPAQQVAQAYPVQVQAAPQAQPVPAPSQSHVRCERDRQAGCFQQIVLSVKRDPNNKNIQGLDTPLTSSAQADFRTSLLGPNLARDMIAGRATAVAPVSFLVLFWGEAFPTDVVAAYGLESQGPKLVRTQLEDVTGKIMPEAVTQDARRLGTPVKVLRIRTNDWGMAFQFPHSVINKDRRILVYAEGVKRFYPSPKNKEIGLWLLPPGLEFIQKGGHTRGTMAFVLE